MALLALLDLLVDFAVVGRYRCTLMPSTGLSFALSLLCPHQRDGSVESPQMSADGMKLVLEHEQVGLLGERAECWDGAGLCARREGRWLVLPLVLVLLLMMMMMTMLLLLALLLVVLLVLLALLALLNLLALPLVLLLLVSLVLPRRRGGGG